MRQRRSRGRRAEVVLLASVGLLGACTWSELDAVRTVALTPPPQDSSPGVDAEAPVDAPADEPEIVDSAAASLPCTSSPTVLGEWTFDTSTENWNITSDSGVQGQLQWNDAMGNPTPGSLEVVVDPGSSDSSAARGTWLQYGTPLGNLAGRTVSAWVWLDSGPSPRFKVFVQTGTKWVWADSGVVTLTPHQWTCVSLPVSNPTYNGADYDPTNVIETGFEMIGTEPFRLFIDTVRYY